MGKELKKRKHTVLNIVFTIWGISSLAILALLGLIMKDAMMTLQVGVGVFTLLTLIYFAIRFISNKIQDKNEKLTSNYTEDQIKQHKDNKKYLIVGFSGIYALIVVCILPYLVAGFIFAFALMWAGAQFNEALQMVNNGLGIYFTIVKVALIILTIGAFSAYYYKKDKIRKGH